MTSVFKDNAVKGRVVLITGGGSGIGFGVANELGLHGAKIVIMGRRQNFLDDAVAKLKKNGIDAAGIAGDVRNEESAQKAIDFVVGKYGKLDTLINGAAGNFLALAEEMSVNAFRTVMEIDTIGTFVMSRLAFPELKKSGTGVVINISATLHYATTWYQIHSSTAKAAIDQVTKQLGLEWGKYNIRVNGIAPGPIADTPGMLKLAGGNKDVNEILKKSIPLGRAGATKDIAQTALFLCTDAASYITGHTMVVDGGEWFWRPAPIPREVVSEMSRKVEKDSRAMKAKL